MTDMTREVGRLAIAALESANEIDTLMYLTVFVQLHTDTRTPMVIDAVMRGDYAAAIEQMRLQLTE